MIYYLLLASLIVILHSSLLANPEGLGLSGPTSPSNDASHQDKSSISTLEAIQQNLYNQYTSTPFYNRANLPEGIELPPEEMANNSAIQAIRQQHSQLITQYFKDKATPNIDNGNSNTINGLHNIIQAGDENNINGAQNVLNGSKNYINGSQNNVHGNQNQISSGKNVVYGSGNIIMDKLPTKDSNNQGKVPEQASINAKQHSLSPVTPTNSKITAETSISGSSSTPTNNLSHQFEHFLAFVSALTVLFILQ